MSYHVNVDWDFLVDPIGSHDINVIIDYSWFNITEAYMDGTIL